MCTHVHMYKKSHILPRTKTKRGLSIGSHLNESEGRGEILDPSVKALAKCCARRCSTYCLMSSGSRVVRENRAAGRLCSPEPGKGSSRRHRVPRQPSGASRRPASLPGTAVPAYQPATEPQGTLVSVEASFYSPNKTQNQEKGVWRPAFDIAFAWLFFFFFLVIFKRCVIFSVAVRAAGE